MKDISLIKDVLEETIKRLGIKKGLEENMAVSCWNEVVGEKIAAKSEAIKIIKGCLYVKTASPVWSQQLSLMGEEIKNKVNVKLGKNVVKQIRFKS